MNGKTGQKVNILDQYFEVSKSKSTVKAEILADPYIIMGDTAMAGKIANGVFIGTYIGAFIGTFLCAVYAKVPFAQAPGIGLFITIIGLKNADLIISNPATLVSMMDFSQWRTPGADLTVIVAVVFIIRYAFMTMG